MAVNYHKNVPVAKGFIRKLLTKGQEFVPAAQARCLQARPGTSNFSMRNSKAGFTLIELLVSVGLFSTVMMVSIGTLLSLVDANRQAQSLKSVTNNLNFALDSMTRSLRTGSGFSCDGGSDCSSGGTSITFIDYRKCRLTFSFGPDSGNSQIGRIYRTVENTSESSCTTSTNLPITAVEVDINAMRFYVTGSDNWRDDGDVDQPYVTISMQGTAGSGESDSAFNVQASAVSRWIDI